MIARNEPPPSYAETEELLRDSGWSIIHISPFSDLVGPAWKRDGEHRFAFVMKEKHDNSLGRAHGGMIMSFCDDGLGVTARVPHPGKHLLTISFECKFISGPKLGELVELQCEIVKATTTLSFVRGTCMVGSRVVADASGIWKAVSRA
ncbi:PaaI family thioesterase [Rhizobium sp. TH2]|uniref:PaaI family thioesterase n=1 Tax=Rhizobium sp. TH2 TaxID=2775403 RepID=UPI002157DA7A|nr:PaaI family thioesterase [Rhizobium sp. TH2]UVC08849.1 PaaI family thioesterase [Rhizobium sp. TH2]